MDIVTYIRCRKYVNKVTKELAGGLKYQGSKPTVADLPTPSESIKGHLYTVTENGHEYVCDGTQWVDLSVDLAKKQDKLTAGYGINLDSEANIAVTYGKFIEREESTTADRLVAYKDNTGLQKQIAVDWDSSLGRLSTSEFNATTVGGGEGKLTATKLSDGTTTSNVSDVLSGAALGATSLQAADKTELQNNINQEVTDRQTADTTLNNAITTEVNARETAINNVNESINQEAIAREQADSTLQNNITSEETARIAADNTKVDKQVVGTNGKALIFNEADGGGAKFEHTDGTWSFTGVNDGGASGLAAQIYAVDSNDSYKGSKLDITKGGMYYTTGEASGLPATQRDVTDNELVVRKDITDKLDILPVVDDPTDPGYGYPYWIPYSFATTPKADGLDIILKTLTLDNTLRKMNFTNAFPVANSTQAGIMTAADKVNLDTINSDYLKAADKTELENSISTEASARETADTSLDERIDEIVEVKDIEQVDTIIGTKTYRMVYANGIALRIEDNTTENIGYYCTADGTGKSVAIPYGAIVHGGGLGTADKVANFDSSLIVMNGGNLRGIYGGSRGYGSVGNATIIINGGKLIEGAFGGGAAPNANEINSVGIANMKFNGGESLFNNGGGMGHSTVGKVNLEVSGGNHQWMTAGGANGYVGLADVKLSGGTMTCFQTVNRGMIQEADVEITGGTIANVYAGGETSDSTVNGKCEKAILHIRKSFGGHLNKGTYGGVEDATRVSGDYISGTVTDAEATACNLTAITEKQDKLVSGTNIKTVNGNSLLGSGNIEIKTFQPFPDDIKTGENGESLSDFISSIEDSSGAKEGMAYLGSIYGDVLPWTTGGNAECKIEYVTDWIALVTVSSSNIAPYYWTMNTAERTWNGMQRSLTASTGIDITDATIKATGVEYKNNDTAQSNALKFVRVTQAQYDALATKDADTLYMIIG